MSLAGAIDALLARQTPDGALPMAASPTPLRVIPYFGNLAAFGLVAAAGDSSTPAAARRRCLDAAWRWAEWYDAHRSPDGTEFDHEGTSGAWKPTGHYDSTDSYASTYLELLAALHRSRPDAAWLRGRYPFVRQSVAAMDLTRQPNGLTTATPKWPVMYAMDNVEGLRGVRAAAALAKASGNAADARAWDALAGKMAAAIVKDLWDSAGNCFLVGLQTDGGRMTAAKGAWYPDVMAQLMVIGWFPGNAGWAEKDRAALYGRVAGRFAAAPGTGVPSGAATESDIDRLAWWGFAARAAGDTARYAAVRKALLAAPRPSDTMNPALLGHVCRLLAASREP